MISRRLRADLALVLVCLVWGSTFILVKGALEQVSTLLFLTIRFAAASVALAIVFRAREEKGSWSHVQELRAGAIVGLCLFTGYCLQTSGLRYTTAAKAGFITGFYIPLVPLIGAIIYRRMPYWSEALGMILATAGMALLTMPSFGLSIGRGDLLVLGSTVAYALHILALGYFARFVSHRKLALYQISTGAILGALTFWWLETPNWHFTGEVLLALVVTSLLATAFAFSIQSWAQQFTTPTRTALIFSMEPVFAWAASFLIAGETLSGRALIGAGLILSGIVLAELKPAS